MTDEARRRRLLSDGAKVVTDIGRALFVLPAGAPAEPGRAEVRRCWAAWSSDHSPAAVDNAGYCCAREATTDMFLCVWHQEEIFGDPIPVEMAA